MLSIDAARGVPLAANELLLLHLDSSPSLVVLADRIPCQLFIELCSRWKETTEVVRVVLVFIKKLLPLSKKSTL
jgi:hypothetical protein